MFGDAVGDIGDPESETACPGFCDSSVVLCWLGRSRRLPDVLHGGEQGVDITVRHCCV